MASCGPMAWLLTTRSASLSRSAVWAPRPLAPFSSPAKPWGKVVLEVDEHQHSHYPAACDVRRDFDILASVALGSADRLCIVHYNPGAYQVGGVTQSVSKKQREARLLQVLGDLEMDPGRPFSRLFVYYNRHAHDSLLPLVA